MMKPMTKHSLLRNLLVARYFKPNKEEQGISLLLALMMGLVLITGATGLLIRQQMTRKIGSSESYQQMAETAASNGFNRIISELNNDRPASYRGYLYAIENRCLDPVDAPAECESASDHYYWSLLGSKAVPVGLGELCANTSAGLPVHPEGSKMVWPTDTVPFSEDKKETLRDDGKEPIQTFYRLRSYRPELGKSGNGQGRFSVEGLVKRVGAEDNEYLARTLLTRTLSIETKVPEVAVMASRHYNLGPARINGPGVIIVDVATADGFPAGCNATNLLNIVKGNNSNQPDLGSHIWPVLERGMLSPVFYEGDDTKDKEPDGDHDRIWSFDDSAKGASGCEDSVVCTSSHSNGKPKKPEGVEITGSWGGSSTDDDGHGGISGSGTDGGSSNNQRHDDHKGHDHAKHPHDDHKQSGNKNAKYWADKKLATPPAGFSPIDYVRPTDSQLTPERLIERRRNEKEAAQWSTKIKQRKTKECEDTLARGYANSWPDRDKGVQKCADWGMWSSKNPITLKVKILNEDKTEGSYQTVRTTLNITPEQYAQRLWSYERQKKKVLEDFYAHKGSYDKPNIEQSWSNVCEKNYASTHKKPLDKTIGRGIQGIGARNRYRIICDELVYGGFSSRQSAEGSNITKNTKYWTDKNLIPPPAGTSPFDYMRPADSQLTDQRKRQRSNREKQFNSWSMSKQNQQKEWCQKQLNRARTSNWWDTNEVIKCGDWGMWADEESSRAKDQLSPLRFTYLMDQLEKRKKGQLQGFYDKNNQRVSNKWEGTKRYCEKWWTNPNHRHNWDQGAIGRGLNGMSPMHYLRIKCEEVIYKDLKKTIPNTHIVTNKHDGHKGHDHAKHPHDHHSGHGHGQHTHDGQAGNGQVGNGQGTNKGPEDWVVKISKDDICSNKGNVCHLYVENINLKNTKVLIENDTRPVVIHLVKSTTVVNTSHNIQDKSGQQAGQQKADQQTPKLSATQMEAGRKRFERMNASQKKNWENYCPRVQASTKTHNKHLPPDHRMFTQCIETGHWVVNNVSGSSGSRDANTTTQNKINRIFKLTDTSTFCGVDKGKEACNEKPERLVITSTDGDDSLTCDKPSNLELTIAGESLPSAWISLPKGRIQLSGDASMRGVIWADNFCSQGNALKLTTKQKNNADESIVKAADSLWNLNRHTSFKAYGRSITRGIRGNLFDIFKRW